MIGLPPPNLKGVLGGTRGTRVSITMKFTHLARACLEFESNAKSLGAFIWEGPPWPRCTEYFIREKRSLEDLLYYNIWIIVFKWSFQVKLRSVKWTFQEGRFSQMDFSGRKIFTDIKDFTIELSEYEGIPFGYIEYILHWWYWSKKHRMWLRCVINEDKDWMDG